MSRSLLVRFNARKNSNNPTSSKKEKRKKKERSIHKPLKAASHIINNSRNTQPNSAKYEDTRKAHFRPVHVLPEHRTVLSFHSNFLVISATAKLSLIYTRNAGPFSLHRFSLTFSPRTNPFIVSDCLVFWKTKSLSVWCLEGRRVWLSGVLKDEESDCLVFWKRISDSGTLNCRMVNWNAYWTQPTYETYQTPKWIAIHTEALAISYW